MVDGGEVAAQRHVVEVGVGLARPQRRVDELLVLARQRDAPGLEVPLQGLELRVGQLVAEAARSAVRQERDPAVAEPERLGRL